MFRNLFKKESTTRVVPNHSVREISDRKQKLDSELRAAIYLYNDEKFIVCSVAGIAEYGEPVVLDVNTPDNELGLALCDKLLEFKPRNTEDLSKSKLEDWAAFKVSGEKTGKSFEEKSMYVYIKTVKSAINIEASPRVSLEKQLRALCSISNGLSHSEIGNAIRKAVKAATVLRQSGML